MVAALALAPRAGAQLVPPLPPLPPTGGGGQVQPYGTNDFGGFRNVLPPGTNGLVNLLQLAAYETTHARPPHNDDQLQMYANLATAAPNIQESQISHFYKDATFGVPAGDAGSSESPEPGVTIVRDSAYGVPHIYGDTRAELMFGIGYATAEDRLFFIDVLRHAGEADLAGFAGGSNVSMDEAVWASEPYTPQDLMNQVNSGRTHSPYGQQIYADSTNFVGGINAYIAKAQNPLFTATMMPGEYAALGMPQGPQPFTLEDMVSIATLVGGIFGNGGGDQLSNATLYEDLERRFGPERVTVAGSPELVKPRPARRGKRAKPRHSNDASPARTQAKRKRRHTRPASPGDHSGFATFLSFVDPSDPEAPTTVRGASFPYQTLPRRAGPCSGRLRCRIAAPCSS